MGTIPKWILDMAKKMDTPEMRELYRSQKIVNPNLDKDCEQFTEEIKDVFDHLRTPEDDKS